MVERIWLMISFEAHNLFRIDVHVIVERLWLMINFEAHNLFGVDVYVIAEQRQLNSSIKAHNLFRIDVHVEWTSQIFCMTPIASYRPSGVISTPSRRFFHVSSLRRRGFFITGRTDSIFGSRSGPFSISFKLDYFKM